MMKVMLRVCGRGGKKSDLYADPQRRFVANSPLKTKAYRYVYGSGPYF